MKTLLTLVLLNPFVVAMADECAPPPVNGAEQAICLAKKFANQSKPKWALKFQAKELASDWLVSYSPKNSQVRGVSGEVQVSKVSGTITIKNLQR